jgi:hypothetical protein
MSEDTTSTGRFPSRRGCLWARIRALPSCLDWFVSVLERLIVLAIGLAVLYAGYWLLFGGECSPQGSRLGTMLKTVNDNWKAMLLVAVPLFYRAARTFLEQVEEAWGMKRRRETIPPTPQQNPPGL